MKSKLKLFINYSTAILALAVPVLASAAGGVQSGLQGSGLQNIFGIGGLTGVQDLRTLILAVIQILLFFAGAVAVIFVIIGGYYYVTSGGNEETAEKGKKTLINAIIGIIVVVLAYVIINVIVNLVSGPSGFGF